MLNLDPSRNLFEQLFGDPDSMFLCPDPAYKQILSYNQLAFNRTKFNLYVDQCIEFTSRPDLKCRTDDSLGRFIRNFNVETLTVFTLPTFGTKGNQITGRNSLLMTYEQFKIELSTSLNQTSYHQTKFCSYDRIRDKANRLNPWSERNFRYINCGRKTDIIKSLPFLMFNKNKFNQDLDNRFEVYHQSYQITTFEFGKIVFTDHRTVQTYFEVFAYIGGIASGIRFLIRGLCDRLSRLSLDDHLIRLIYREKRIRHRVCRLLACRRSELDKRLDKDLDLI